MSLNEIRMRIEKDGTITVDTGSFEEEVHLSAENFVKEVFEAIGGEPKVIERKRPELEHSHLDGVQHTHGG
jgi:hypothetical protein